MTRKRRLFPLTLVSGLQGEFNEISSPLLPQRIASLHPFLGEVPALKATAPSAILICDSGHRLEVVQRKDAFGLLREERGSRALGRPQGSRLALRVILKRVRNRQTHDQNIAALLHRHVLIVSIGVASSVGEVSAQIVHRIGVGVLAAQHVLNQGLQEIRQPSRVGVEEEGECWEDNIDGLEVAVGRDLLQE